MALRKIMRSTLCCVRASWRFRPHSPHHDSRPRRHSPRISRDHLFLVLGIGYALGKLKVGSFSLDAVTGTLLAGVAVGQLGFTSRVRSSSVFSCCSCSNRIQDRAAILPWSEERRP
jgi:hypothetical protein